MAFCGKFSPTRNGKDHCVSEKGRFAVLHAAQNPLPDPSMSPTAGGVWHTSRDRVGILGLHTQGPLQLFPYWTTAVQILKNRTKEKQIQK